MRGTTQQGGGGAAGPGRRSGATWRPRQETEVCVEPGLYLDPFLPETVRFWTGTAWAPEAIGLSDDPGRRAARDIQQRYGASWQGVLVHGRAADDAEALRKRPPAWTPNRLVAWVVLAVLAVALGHGLNTRSFVGAGARGDVIDAVTSACYDRTLSRIVECTDPTARWQLVKKAATCEPPLVAREQAYGDYDSDVFCLRRLGRAS